MAGNYQKQCVISQQTVDDLKIIKGWPDAIALYIFYYYSANWQKTNQPWVTAKFCQKGLSWGTARFRQADKILREAGLIKKVPGRSKDGKIAKWYVRVVYWWSTAKDQALMAKKDKPQGVVSSTLVKPPCGVEETNASNAITLNSYNDNKNAYSASALPPKTELELTESQSSKLLGGKKEADGRIDQIVAAYQAKVCAEARLFSKSRKLIAQRLKTFSFEELLSAIDNFSKDKWWLEHNASRGLAWFFRDDDHVEQFLNLKPVVAGDKIIISSEYKKYDK